jgi:hypothetical protein
MEGLVSNLYGFGRAMMDAPEAGVAIVAEGYP